MRLVISLLISRVTNLISRISGCVLRRNLLVSTVCAMSSTVLPSPWSFRGRLHEDQELFFKALAAETGMDESIFMKMSTVIRCTYMRKTLAHMLKLTTLQMRNVIADSGGQVEWLSTIEDMLNSKFASPVECAATEPSVVNEGSTISVCSVNNKVVPTAVRVSKFMESGSEQTLGKRLHQQGILVDLKLPDEIFEVVNTPYPQQQ